MLRKFLNRIKGFFKNLPARLKRWWKGEMMDFKRKTATFPDDFKAWAKSKIGSAVVLVILAIFIIVGMNAIKKARLNAIVFVDDYEAPEATVNLFSAGEFVPVAKNDKLELLFCEEKGAIKVKDLQNGFVWSSIVDEEICDISGYKKSQLREMQNALTVSYYDLKKRDSKVQELLASKDCGSLEVEYIDNGISLTYGFLKRGIYVNVEYFLDGDNLVVRVPWEKIEEKTKYAVSSIKVVPYFGACDNTSDGYLFYPDGCGAITCFDRADRRNSNVSVAQYYTYSDRIVQMQKFFSENMKRYVAYMPVFGIKNGNNAVLAFATEGAANTGITVSPAGTSMLAINRICFDIFTRNIFNVSLGTAAAGDSSASGAVIQRVDKYLIHEDKEIRFAFLNGDKADYSGMAAVYRDYLIENGLLHDVITEEEDYPVALRMLMGTTKAGVAFDEYIAMTTFGQVRDMLEELESMKVSSQKVVLDEWCRKSEDYNYWGPEGRLGGKSGLKKLGAYAEENPGTDIFLQQSTALCTADTKGIKEAKDVVYDGLAVEVSIDMYKVGMTYLLNPAVILKRNGEMLKKLKSYDGIDIAYDNLGKFVYADYNENHPYTKNESVTELRNVLKETKEKDKNIAVSGSNQYVFSYADYLYELSENSYGLAITDFSVPFVQMVVSGCIPYATQGAGNLAYDMDIQKLKWIEFGSIPYFRVTHESALNLRDTDHDMLFSSTWDDWKSTIADTYSEFKENLGCVYGKQMIEHRIISDRLYAVTYENGVKIYINYDKNEAHIDGLTIPAKGYVVTGGSSK